MQSPVLPLYLVALARIVLMVRDFSAQESRMISRARSLAAREIREIECARNQRTSSCRARVAGQDPGDSVIFRRQGHASSQGRR